jgi:hypothetical protein
MQLSTKKFENKSKIKSIKNKLRNPQTPIFVKIICYTEYTNYATKGETI